MEGLSIRLRPYSLFLASDAKKAVVQMGSIKLLGQVMLLNSV